MTGVSHAHGADRVLSAEYLFPSCSVRHSTSVQTSAHLSSQRKALEFPLTFDHTLSSPQASVNGNRLSTTRHDHTNHSICPSLLSDVRLVIDRK